MTRLSTLVGVQRIHRLRNIRTINGLEIRSRWNAGHPLERHQAVRSGTVVAGAQARAGGRAHGGWQARGGLGAAGVAAAATGVVGTAVGGLAIGGPISTALKVAAVTVGVAVVVVPVTGGVIWQSDEDLPAAAAVLPTQPNSPEPTFSPSRPETVEPTSRPQPTPTTTPSSTPGTVIEVDAIDLWQPASPAPTRSTPTPIDPGTLPGPAQPVSPGPAESATPSTPATPDGETGSPETGSPATPSPGTSGPGSPTEPTSGGTPTSATTPGAPVVAAVGTAAGYIAPLLSGAAAPLATVAIQIIQAGPTTADTTVTYAVTADANGAWNFDLSSLGLTANSYRAIVWQVVAQASSPATVLDFSTSAPRVDGLPEEATLYDVDAEVDGIVITIVAPGQQQACLRASTGQEATIPLAADGTASRRVRFQGLGTFELEVAICQDGRYGSPTRSTITIVEKFFTPWPVELEPAIFIEEV